MKEIEIYLNSLRLGNKSEASLRVYTKDLNKFVSFFNLETLADLDKLTVSDYQNFYNSQKSLSAVSLNGLIRTLSAFFKWLMNSELISGNSFFKVRFGNKKFLKESREAMEVLTDEELERLIKAGSNIQTKFMLCLMAYNGLRRDEVRRIKLTDISECSILIHGKGDKKFIVSLHKTVCTMLSIFMSQRDSTSEYLFYSERGETSESGMISGNSINKRVKSAGKLAGLPEEKLNKLHAHSLRHAFATYMIKEFGLDVAQQAMRHSNSETTKRYDHSGNYASNKALLSQRDLNVLDVEN